MNKRIENIYNNNFNFTNNLILKRRKQNQVLALISITFFLFIAYLFTKLVKDDHNIRKDSNKQDFSKNSVILNKFSFNNSNAFNRYYAFSIIDFKPKRNTVNKFSNQMSFNFLKKASNNFLTEICFEKASLIFKHDDKRKSDDDFPSFRYLSEAFISHIDKYINFSFVCFIENSDKILVKIKNNLYLNRLNRTENKSEILIDIKKHSSSFYENKLNRGALPSKLRNYKIFESLMFFRCDESLISFDLEKHYNFYFNKKPYEKYFDATLLATKPEKFKIYSVPNKNFCLSNQKNKMAIMSKSIPKCLEFVNFIPKDLLEDNVIYEIDLFIYDLKSNTMSLYFLNKVKIRKEISSSYSDSDKNVYPLSIIYENRENTEEVEKRNFRVCNLLKNPKILDKRIKMRGIYLEWNFIKEVNSNVEDEKNICFDKLLSIG